MLFAHSVAGVVCLPRAVYLRQEIVHGSAIWRVVARWDSGLGIENRVIMEACLQVSGKLLFDNL